MMIMISVPPQCADFQIAADPSPEFAQFLR